MSPLIGVLTYTIVWFCSMYIILRRLHAIRKRTEKRLLEFDSQYTFPVYNHPWVFSVIFGVLAYLLSIVVIISFLK